MRLGYALLGPLMLLLISAYAVSFDVEHVRFTVLDEDHSYESREFLDRLAAPRYFRRMAPSASRADADAKLRNGEAQFIVDIPPDFGRDLIAARSPQIGVFIDGSIPFTGTNVRGYMNAINLQYAAAQAGALHGDASPLPVSIEPRFAYNQEFKSIYAGTPGVIMLALTSSPMLTALGASEKGDRLHPQSLLLTRERRRVPPRQAASLRRDCNGELCDPGPCRDLHPPRTPQGLFPRPLARSAVVRVRRDRFGLDDSGMVGSQVAAIFGTAIICLVPGTNFSGMLYPVSTLTGAAYWTGIFFPASWFQLVSLGAFTKGLGIGSFWWMYVALAGFTVCYLLAARLLVKKQER